MARRKNGFLSDGSDSDASVQGGSDSDANSQEDGDSRAERRLFEHKGKRRRTGGKESAWEGIFGEDEDERPRAARGLGARRGKAPTGSRTDWTKAPAFVAKSEPAADAAAHDQPARDVEEDVEEDDDDDDDDDSNIDDDDDDTRAPSPRVRDEEADEPPRATGLGGLGFRAAGGIGSASLAGKAPESKPPGRAGLGLSARAGLGSQTPAATGLRGGIGSSTQAPNPVDDDEPRPASVPTAFGRSAPVAAASTSAPRRSFMSRPSTPSTSSPAPTAATLTAAERSHFSSISGSFGARMLAKQGWEAGKGLGANEDGRAIPVQVGVLARGQGISSGIRTEESKREARRKGHAVDEDEEDEPKRGQARRQRAPAKERDDSWRRQRKVKVKVEHKTYEQLVAEAGDATQAGVGLVLDARGGELREVQSISDLSLSTWTPTGEDMQLPELRHNLRLIMDMAKGDVDNLAREGRTVNERRRWAVREEQRARRKLELGDQPRLQSVQAVVDTINAVATAEAAKADASLQPLGDSFHMLLDSYKDEYAALGLDEIVVGAIAQVLRNVFASWQPFDLSSDMLLTNLKQWRRAFNLPDDTAVVKTGDAPVSPDMTTMSAWESLLWNLWLPQVRSTINNEWDPATPIQAVHLLESWDPLLPTFIRENVLDQLVLPKVRRVVEQWDGRPSRSGKPAKSLAGIIFPWLPLLGARANDLLDEGKRRIRSLLRKWAVSDGVPAELVRWKQDAYASSDWDKLIGEYVLGKLGETLREEFTINPRAQNMEPLRQVLAWHALVRPSNFARLFELEFFPRWLDVLYIWLTHPGYNGDEVASWYEMWKTEFAAVLDNPAIKHGFQVGLALIGQAVDLGSAAPTALRKPEFKPLPSKSKSKRPHAAAPVARRPVDESEITFRAIAEDFIASKDLLFLPLGKSHDRSGKPLSRVAKTVDGRGGVTVYVGEDAVFAQGDDGAFRAITLEDLATRAGA